MPKSVIFFFTALVSHLFWRFIPTVVSLYIIKPTCAGFCASAAHSLTPQISYLVQSYSGLFKRHKKNKKELL